MPKVAILALLALAAGAAVYLALPGDGEHTARSATRQAAEPSKGTPKKPAPEPATEAVRDIESMDRDGRRAAFRKLRADKDVATLIDALRSSDREVQRLAVRALMRLKAKGTAAALVAMDTGDDVDLLLSVLQTLRILKDPAAIETFAKHLTHADEKVVQAAAHGLWPYGRKAVFTLPTLIDIVISGEERHLAKRSALELMSRFGPDALPALPHLIKAVETSAGHEMGAMDVIKAIGPQAAAAAPALAKRLFEFERMKDEFNRKNTGISVSWAGIGYHAQAALVAIGAESVPELIKGLGDPVWGVRYHAADALGDLGADAIPALKQAARDGNARARANVAEIFARLGKKHPELLDEVRRLAEDESPRVRAEAVQALAWFGEQTVPDMLKALQDDGTVLAALVALKKLGRLAKRATGDLIQVTTNEQPAVRAYVAETLGAIGDPAAIPALVALLGDKNDSVRENARDALARIGKPARAALVEVISRGDPRAKAEAAKALGRIGGADDVQVELIASKDPGVRLTAALALAKTAKRPDLAIPVLREALKPDEKLHRFEGSERIRDVAVALAAYGKAGAVAVPDVVRALLFAIKQGYWMQHESAAIEKALGKLAVHNPAPLFDLFDTKDIHLHFIGVRAAAAAGPAALPRAREVALGGTPREKEAAVRVLEKLKDRPGLEKMLDNRNEEAREQAARALWELTKDADQIVPVMLDLIEKGQVQHARSDAAWFLQGKIPARMAAKWLDRIRELANREAESYVRYLLKKAIDRIESR